MKLNHRLLPLPIVAMLFVLAVAGANAQAPDAEPAYSPDTGEIVAAQLDSGAALTDGTVADFAAEPLADTSSTATDGATVDSAPTAGERELPPSGLSNAELVTAARRSPLFRRTWQPGELRRSNVGKLRIVAGVEMDFDRYVAETSLPRQPKLAGLFDGKAAGLLTGKPEYQETVLELQDRLIVDRRVSVSLAAGACAKAGLPPAVAELCFTKNPRNAASKAVQADLVTMRKQLATMPGDTPVSGKLTVAEATKMSDEALLDLLLNGSARSIQQVSIVPRQPYGKGAAGADPLRQFGQRLPAASFETGLVPVLVGDLNIPTVELTSDGLPTRYFLTGFTLGKQIDDSWEYTFIEGSWWHDRYYVKVDYHVSLGFGLREPFAVNVSSTNPGTGPGGVGIGGSTRNVTLSVTPVNVDANGNPAYPAVGLPSSKTFGGKELVLQLTAGCHLYVSIPGPNISRDCPSVNLNYSRDVNPVIGSGVSSIGEWWLNGTTTGLAINLGVASASLDIGLGADIRNGVIGMRSTAIAGSQISAGGTGNLLFNSTAARAFTVTRAQNSTVGGFQLQDPTYRFDVRATPMLRAKVGVDVAVYEHTWTIGPFPLDFLAIEATFQLGRHAGTVASHNYQLFEGIGPIIQP